MIQDEVWRVDAWAPGHVTGFFTIEDDAEDPARIGSTGAGFSVEAGVASRVTMRRRGFPGVDLTLNGAPYEADTTRAAIQYMLGREPWNVTVEQVSDLPVGHGFGASAAGALSATLAVAAVLGRDPSDAVWAAHAAEVVERTGLGDVVGAAQGGFEIRERPGLPPHGKVRPFATDRRGSAVTFLVLDTEVRTRDVLGDQARRDRIRRAGRTALADLLESPDVSTFCRTSDRFAVDAALRSDRVAACLTALDADGSAGQCMLGASVFAFETTDEALADAPHVRHALRTRVAERGACVTSPPERVEPA